MTRVDRGRSIGDSPQLIIVGAGAAGMNCALDLKEAEHDYLLIADYMGGRIFNDTSNRNPDDTRQWSALSAKTASDLPSSWRSAT